MSRWLTRDHKPLAQQLPQGRMSLGGSAAYIPLPSILLRFMDPRQRTRVWRGFRFEHM
jgi:hypothetical protein